MTDLYTYIKTCESLPAMPNVVMKALGIIKDESAGISDLAKIVSYDQSLTTQILKLVNSAYYGMPQQITSIKRAIALLGTNEIKKNVIAIAMKPMLTSRGGKHLWEHSIACAVAAETLAKDVNIIHPSEAFLLGFLHDIGKIVLNHNSPIIYNKLKILQSEGNDILELEKFMLGATHTDVGFALARKWQLPIVIANCIKYHHRPKLSSISNLISIITFADMIVNQKLESSVELKNVEILTNIKAAFARSIANKIMDTASELIDSLA